VSTTQEDRGAAARPAPRQTRRRRSRVSLVAGLLLLALGVGVLGWAGWQYWGTSWVSHRTQQQVTAQVERSWDHGTDTVRTEHGLAGAVVRIPRFGRDYAVPVLEGVSDDVLASGYGHFEGSAEPGQVGNFALAAHRVTHGEPLRDMPELRVGDEVVVDTRTMRYTYALTTGGDDLTVPFTAGWVVDAAPLNPQAGGTTPALAPGARLITLTTCSELFHTDDRLVAFGVLTSAVPRG